MTSSHFPKEAGKTLIASAGKPCLGGDVEANIKKPSAGPRIASIVLGVVGSVLSLPIAALLGFALGFYPSRMECTNETLGSGCYEGDLLNATILFAIVFLPFFLPTLFISLHERSRAPEATDLMPLIALCAVPAVVIVVCALLALVAPGSL